MNTTSKYEKMASEFQEQWEGNGFDLMEAVMVLDASRMVLKNVFDGAPTNGQVIEFSKVILKLKQR